MNNFCISSAESSLHLTFPRKDVSKFPQYPMTFLSFELQFFLCIRFPFIFRSERPYTPDLFGDSLFGALVNTPILVYTQCFFLQFGIRRSAEVEGSGLIYPQEYIQYSNKFVLDFWLSCLCGSQAEISFPSAVGLWSWLSQVDRWRRNIFCRPSLPVFLPPLRCDRCCHVCAQCLSKCDI